MKAAPSYNSNSFSKLATDYTLTTHHDVKMQDSNLNLNLIGLLTSDRDLNNWRSMQQSLQVDGYSSELKDSDYDK